MSECPGCAREIGDLKICPSCYRRLPDDIRRALYYLIGEVEELPDSASHANPNWVKV